MITQLNEHDNEIWCSCAIEHSLQLHCCMTNRDNKFNGKHDFAVSSASECGVRLLPRGSTVAVHLGQIFRTAGQRWGSQGHTNASVNISPFDIDAATYNDSIKSCHCAKGVRSCEAQPGSRELRGVRMAVHSCVSCDSTYPALWRAWKAASRGSSSFRIKVW